MRELGYEAIEADSVETARRSQLADAYGSGYSRSHSRWFWGLRLHLVCTPAGLPITFALANPKIDEREVARDLFEAEPTLLRPGQRILADKGYRSKEFESFLAQRGVELVRPAHKNDRGLCASSSNRSTPRSRPSSISNAMGAEPQVV